MLSIGNKRLSLLPVALSLTVSYVSGMAMLGLPAEIYFFGIHGLSRTAALHGIVFAKKKHTMSNNRLRSLGPGVTTVGGFR